MRHTKQEKIEYLFSEIGLIEDNLVHEAICYLPARRRRPILLVAASLVLSLTVIIAAFAIASVSHDSAGNMNGDDCNHGGIFDSDEDHSSYQKFSSLDSLLLSERENANYTTLASGERPEYRNGKSYLVWQYEGSDELCVSRALTASEISRLSSNIGKGTEVGESSPTLSCKVWILTGDGSVISPYLKPSNGNVGVTLFDYDPEIIPGDAFISCVSDILEA